MSVTTVHLVFKTHLDVGFTDLAKNVIQQYFDHFIPGALDLATAMRERSWGEALDRYGELGEYARDRKERYDAVGAELAADDLDDTLW